MDQGRPSVRPSVIAPFQLASGSAYTHPPTLTIHPTKMKVKSVLHGHTAHSLGTQTASTPHHTTHESFVHPSVVSGSRPRDSSEHHRSSTTSTPFLSSLAPVRAAWRASIEHIYHMHPSTSTSSLHRIAVYAAMSVCLSVCLAVWNIN
mmetsp:Transcript_26135/g.64941  ORF Transcript_26135/g.64941 Transcript_26135/m.64941 type:complete len:148 (-) Transcript_26135:1692-2135(-)